MNQRFLKLSKNIRDCAYDIDTTQAVCNLFRILLARKPLPQGNW